MTMSKRFTYLAVVCLLVFALGSACQRNPTVPSLTEGATQVWFRMDVSGLDYTVFLDGHEIGRLNSKDETTYRDVSPGGHRFYVHDNTYNRTSYDVDFDISLGQMLVWTFGSGNLSLHWR